MSKSNLRSPLLSSTTLRQNLAHRTDSQLIHLYNAIDTMGRNYDALNQLYTNPDPALTREGRALRLQQQHEKATAKIKADAVKAMEQLHELQDEIVARAEQKAGLNDRLPDAHAQEIRAALRAMKPAERDKAVREAVQNGDTATVRAITQSPAEFLYGDIKTPPSELAHMMLRRVEPELDDRLQEIETASNMLTGAVEAFVRDTGKMRDHLGEEQAAQQAAAVKAAEAALTAEA